MDRAALDAALAFGLPCGGWCPRGRATEDGRLDPRYPLRETPSSSYPQRTEWNVRDSDGTLILTHGRPRGGTALTITLARRLDRPHLVLDLAAKPTPDPATVRLWADAQDVTVLNVAGPREIAHPGLQDAARAFLEDALRGVRTSRRPA